MTKSLSSKLNIIEILLSPPDAPRIQKQNRLIVKLEVQSGMVNCLIESKEIYGEGTYYLRFFIITANQ